MAAPDIHPSIADLEAFALGKLDSPSSVDVEAHITLCATCQERTAAVGDDALVDLLRCAHPLAAHANDTVSQAQTPPPAPLRWGTITAAPVSLPGELAGQQIDELPLELARHERYRVHRPLGAGGMGSVYEAEHCIMQRRVALKVLNRAFTATPSAVERFRREVRAAARLSHPNIVTAYDAENAGEVHFLVMEHIEGTSLDRVVHEGGPLTVAEACACVRQAALGLQHAHEQGMVHRDVKPANLIRCPDGTVKVLDFGLAALLAECDSGLTDTNVIMGTPDYMAPEQAEDPRRADIRADVYSLGCTLYFLLTGRGPYPAATALSKVLAHREQPVPSLRSACSEAPPELAAVVERMLAKKPKDRYQTAGEVAAALAPFGPQGTPADRLPSRRRGRVLMAVLLLGLLAAAVVYRIQTDKGELVIRTESDNVEVIVRQGGKLVRIFDTKTDKSITLWSGSYDLEIKGSPEGLKLDIDKATLTRGKTVLATIEHLPVAATKGPAKWAELPAKVGVIRALPRRCAVNVCQVSRNGRLVALPVDRNPTDMAFIHVYESATGRLVQEITAPRECFSDFAFVPDDQRLLTASAGNGQSWTFRLWDLEKGTSQVLERVQSPAGWPHHIGISRDGRRLQYSIHRPGLGHASEVIDTATGKVLWRCPEDREQGKLVSYSALSRDGSRCVSGASWDETENGPWRRARFYVRDLDHGKALRVIDLPGGTFIEQPFIDEGGARSGRCVPRREMTRGWAFGTSATSARACGWPSEATKCVGTLWLRQAVSPASGERIRGYASSRCRAGASCMQRARSS
jgi:tRNA A-37 threonylcarbamoyl transferase component Bud32